IATDYANDIAAGNLEGDIIQGVKNIVLKPSLVLSVGSVIRHGGIGVRQIAEPRPPALEVTVQGAVIDDTGVVGGVTMTLVGPLYWS
ncbi:hypothetical protein ACCT09_56120, partial [Rhizobium ruizarguesonis]